MRVKLDQYEEVWKAIKETMNLSDRADPFVDDLFPDAREVPSSGIWYNQESGEEEIETADALVGDGADQVYSELHNMELNVSLELWKPWIAPRPRRRLMEHGSHGACDGNDETLEFEEEPESEDATVPEGVPTADVGANFGCSTT